MTTTPAQRLLEAMLATPRRGLPARLRYRALCGARRLLVATARDPLVRYRLEGTELLLPLSHDLPLHRRSRPAYGTNLSRVAGHLARKYPGLAAIDIGANVGDTAALIHAATGGPVLCVEGERRFFRLLEINAARLGPDVQVVRAFVGEAAGHTPARVHSEGGTAYLTSGGDHAAPLGDVPVVRLSEVTQRHPLFGAARLLKLDTDGLDCRILRSEVELLARMRPAVFFEYDRASFERTGNQGFAVFAALRQAGFDEAVVYENTSAYLCTLRLADTALLEDIDGYFAARPGCYADICAFGGQDAEVCAALRESELALAGKRRGR
jgi:FkbM family methyltransferase